MLRTLLANRPPLEVPTLGGLDDRRPHHPDRRDDRENRRQVRDGFLFLYKIQFLIRISLRHLLSMDQQDLVL